MPKFNVIHLITFYVSLIKPIQVAIGSSNIAGMIFGVFGIKIMLFRSFHIGGTIVCAVHGTQECSVIDIQDKVLMEFNGVGTR